MTTTLAVSRFRVQNFKAIRDSGTVRFTPLTAFIGNNGVGKSSLVEALETLKNIARIGLNKAIEDPWRTFDFIWNQATTHNLILTEGLQRRANSMRFEISGAGQRGFGDYKAPYKYSATSEITSGISTDEAFYLRETLKLTQGGSKRTVTRPIKGPITDQTDDFPQQGMTLPPYESILSAETSSALWQFVRLQPELMNTQRLVRQVAGHLPLATDGSNIAEFLLDIRRIDENAFNGIIETLQIVLPYAVDLQPVVTSELGRYAYLQLREQNIKSPLPAWLLSTGTLRVVALLALLRHPEPPPLIVIEEIENGLDPRTLHLLVEEMRYAVESGLTQIILTTHSPYLLDLLTLSQIVVVERDDSGQPTFHRPSDEGALQQWSEKFTPGQLYTMGRLGKETKNEGRADRRRY